jgi:hypothetical protein
MAEDSYKVTAFPPQRISNSRKTKKWREDCVRYAENMSVLRSSYVRKSKKNIVQNYQLYGGKINMQDVESILNPEGIDYGVETKKIQHYPVMNAKIDQLLGEERNSKFEDRAIITNPTSITLIEKEKAASIKERLQQIIVNTTQDPQALQSQLQDLQTNFDYEYQDIREKNANDLLNHYKKELNFADMFNNGYVDALVAGAEVYYNYIECGEPKVERVNLRELSYWGSNSNFIEDYPYIVRERYMSANEILDIWGDKMSDKDYKNFDKLSRGDRDGENGAIYIAKDFFHFRYGDDPDFVDEDGYFNFGDGIMPKDLPFNIAGGIRVLEVFWKSMSEIWAVHYFDERGDEQVKFVTPDYVLDEYAGETKKRYWKNEAWHGVMIGSGKNAIFVDIGPCTVQHNRMGNPSRCHFGFIGTIYNNNDFNGMSVVDKLKPLSYKYDVMMAKLDSLVARNYGKLAVMDFARVPAGWEPEQWAYFLKLGILPIDSMKEGSMGAAKGKLAGGVANTPLTADAELSGSIQAMIEQLQFIDGSMERLLGITPQRMGSIQNRETVGGVERSVMQSSNVTRRLEAMHEDVKRREETCFLEYVKIASRGKNKKFQFIQSDYTIRNATIDGDMFAESDYGIVLENGFEMQEINQGIDMMAQAKMQNGGMQMSTYFGIKQTSSLAEKMRLLKKEEAMAMQQAQQAQQQQVQLEQQKEQMAMQKFQAELELKREMNIRDNETKLLIAQMGGAITEEPEDNSNELMLQQEKNDIERDKINKQFEIELEKMQNEYRMNQENNRTKEKIANSKPKPTTSNKK